MNGFVQVVTTVSKKSDAEKISEALVGRRLAACVQIIGPIKSVYRWKGKTEYAKEWACLIKTRKTLYKKVESAIRKIHPYEIPEIIAISIVEGSKDYLKWLSSETIKNHG
ncbi:MAG: divalent-cation tolerance protein CutA [Candidatus Omnitrophota bacterium]